MPYQRNSLLNRQGRQAWLNSLTIDEVRALAQQWQLIRWKDTEIGVLRLQLSQIEGVEVPLNTQQ